MNFTAGEQKVPRVADGHEAVVRHLRRSVLAPVRVPPQGLPLVRRADIVRPVAVQGVQAERLARSMPVHGAACRHAGTLLRVRV